MDEKSFDLWTRLQEKSASAEVRNGILAELEALKGTSEQSDLNYARAATFIANREPDWNRRLELLKIVQQMTFEKNASVELLRLHVQGMYHRLNAEVEVSSRHECLEILKLAAKNPRSTPDVLELCARGIMNTMRLEPNIASKRMDVIALKKITKRKNVNSATIDICASAIENVLRNEMNVSRKMSCILCLAEIARRPDATAAQQLMYVKALIHGTERIKKLEAKQRFLAEIERLSATQLNTVQEFMNYYSIALKNVTKEEVDLEPKRVHIETLRKLADAHGATSLQLECYADGLVNLSEETSEPLEQQRVLETLRSLLRRKNGTLKLREKYALALLLRLEDSQVPEERKNLIIRIRSLYFHYKESVELPCIYATALIFMMQFIDEPQKRLALGRYFPKGILFRKSINSGRFQKVLSQFMMTETEPSIRALILSKIRC